MNRAWLLVALAACGGKKAESKEPTAAPLENRLPADAEASEPPPAAPVAAAYTTGSPECDEYLVMFDRVIERCADKLGPALEAMKQSRDAQYEAFKQWGALDEESRQATFEAAATGCKSATEAVKVSAESMGCPPLD